MRRLKCCRGRMRGYVFRCAVTYPRPIACSNSFANFWICPNLTRIEDKVATASREMLLNAMEYGGKFDPERRIEIAYLRARQVVLIRIEDPGEGFSLAKNLGTSANNPQDDPLRHQKHREAQGIRPGGYGILLAKNLVDELFYGEKGNDVLLIKYIN